MGAGQGKVEDGVDARAPATPDAEKAPADDTPPAAGRAPDPRREAEDAPAPGAEQDDPAPDAPLLMAPPAAVDPGSPRRSLADAIPAVPPLAVPVRQPAADMPPAPPADRSDEPAHAELAPPVAITDPTIETAAEAPPAPPATPHVPAPVDEAGGLRSARPADPVADSVVVEPLDPPDEASGEKPAIASAPPPSPIPRPPDQPAKALADEHSDPSEKPPDPAADAFVGEPVLPAPPAAPPSPPHLPPGGPDEVASSKPPSPHVDLTAAKPVEPPSREVADGDGERPPAAEAEAEAEAAVYVAGAAAQQREPAAHRALAPDVETEAPASPPPAAQAKPIVLDPPIERQPPAPEARASRPTARPALHYVARALRLGTGVALALAGLLLALIVLYRWVNPPASALMLGQRLTGTAIVQRWVPIERISPNLIHAVTLSEDGNFCRHRGVDWGEIVDAIDRTRDGAPRGGSTITMQVAKNLFLWPSKSYVRKAIEIGLAYAIDAAWPKRRVLEVYLNIAEWGPGVFGAEAASRFHFNKPASLLSAREAALLAVSLPNPFERIAGSPGPGTQRLANNLMLRLSRASPRVSCIGQR